jgi:hypothetical protein
MPELSGINLSILHVIYKGLLIVGTIVLAMTNGVLNLSAIKGSLLGYALIFSGITFLMLEIIFSYLNNAASSSQPKTNAFLLIISFFPFAIILFVIFWLIRIIYNNQVRLSEGNISADYGSFTKISMILMIIEIVVMLSASSSENFKKNKIIDVVSSASLTLLGIMNAIVAYIVNTILVYYTTDG